MSVIRAVTGLVLGIVVIAVLLMAFAPVYEAIVPVVTGNEAVQDAGFDSNVRWLEDAALHYMVITFLGGLVALAIIHVLREELLQTRRF